MILVSLCFYTSTDSDSYHASSETRNVRGGAHFHQQHRILDYSMVLEQDATALLTKLELPHQTSHLSSRHTRTHAHVSGIIPISLPIICLRHLTESILMTKSNPMSGTAGHSLQKTHDLLQLISSLFFHGAFLFPSFHRPVCGRHMHALLGAGYNGMATGYGIAYQMGSITRW